MIKRIIGMLLICSLTGCFVGNDDHNYNSDKNIMKSHLPLMVVDKLPNSIDVERAVANFFKKHFNKKDLTAIKPFRISQINDSVWRVDCSVEYNQYKTSNVVKNNLSDSATLLLSKRDGRILYFTCYKSK